MYVAFIYSTNFISFGDWGLQPSTENIVHDGMLTALKSTNVDFFVVVGDNFYDNGVTSDTDPLWTQY